MENSIDPVGLLYKLTFANGKSYIGITQQSLVKRIRGHLDGAKAGRQTLICRAIRAHKTFSQSTLLIGRMSYLKKIESAVIISFKTRCPLGYNLSPGGEIAPSTLPEVREKIAASRRGKKASEETRKKLSAAHKGRRAWNKGIPHSEEHKRKIKIACAGKPAWNKGIPMVPEIKATLIASNLGRAPWNKGISTSLETRAKISASTKGKPHSESHRANQLIANRRAAKDQARATLLSKKAKLQWKNPEFRTMMIARHTGAKRSPAARERMRASQIAYQERKHNCESLPD